MNCHNCHSPLPEGARFCVNCGTPVNAPLNDCPRCHAHLEPGSRFCTQCGLPLNEPVAPQPVPVPAAQPQPQYAPAAPQAVEPVPYSPQPFEPEPPQKKSGGIKRHLWWIILLALIVIGGVVTTILVLNKDNDSDYELYEEATVPSDTVDYIPATEEPYYYGETEPNVETVEEKSATPFERRLEVGGTWDDVPVRLTVNLTVYPGGYIEASGMAYYGSNGSDTYRLQGNGNLFDDYYTLQLSETSTHNEPIETGRWSGRVSLVNGLTTYYGTFYDSDGNSYCTFNLTGQ